LVTLVSAARGDDERVRVWAAWGRQPGIRPGDVLLSGEVTRFGRNPAWVAGKRETPGGGPLGVWW
jgi:hypothetical protein